MMLDDKPLERVMFIDIETVPQHSCYEEVDPDLQPLWEKKSAYFRKPEETPGDVYQRAGIYAEFGRIICISAGLVVLRNGERVLRVKSFFSDDERALLIDFTKALESFSAVKGNSICGHNAREFDFPFIARRLIINRLPIPDILDVAGKKPWEVQFLDTMDLWKFGDYKHYTSLNLLTHILGIPSPKDDIDGSEVAGVYYQEKDLERIARYCEKDVLATAQLFLRLKGEPLLDVANVVSV